MTTVRTKRQSGDAAGSHDDVDALRRSEERYRAFIASSADGIFRFELDLPVRVDAPSGAQVDHFYAHGYLAECNDVFARMCGFARSDEIVGARLGVILPRHFAGNLRCLEDFIACGYRLIDAETTDPREQGGPLHYSLSLIGDPADGFLARAWGIRRDISERKALEVHLRAREEQFSTLFEYAAVPMVVAAPDGRLLLANEAKARMTGYSREELSRLSMTDLTHPGDRARVQEIFDELLAGAPGLIETERRYVRKDGSSVIGQTVYTIVRNADGDPSYVLATTRDVTEQKNAVQILEARSRELSLERSWFEQVVDLMPTPILFAEPDTARITLANKAANSVAGGRMPMSQTIDDYARDFAVMTPEGRDLSAEEHPTVRAARGERLVAEEVEWKVGGVKKSLIVDAATLPAMYDHPATVIVAFSDITDLKKTQRENVRLLKQAARAAKRQRSFLKDVLASVTEGKLRLCEEKSDLPATLPGLLTTIPLDTTANLSAARLTVQEAAGALGFTDLRWQNLVTATSECAMNAIVHAGGGIARIYGNGKDRLQVWIEDRGGGISMERIPRATLLRGYSYAGSFGHGFWLMLQTTDCVYLMTSPRGTTVVLEQERDAPLPTWA